MDCLICGARCEVLDVWGQIWTALCVGPDVGPLMCGARCGPLDVWGQMWTALCVGPDVGPLMCGARYGLLYVWACCSVGPDSDARSSYFFHFSDALNVKCP